MEHTKETFTYIYSAAQQEEIAAIRSKYTAVYTEPVPDKMEQLRTLDAEATHQALTASVTTGILGALGLGTGMSLIMTDLGMQLGMARPMMPGIAIGLVGMTAVFGAYPLYQMVLEKARKKIAPDILRLAEELSQQG